jgi:hypothetical protein
VLGAIDVAATCALSTNVLVREKLHGDLDVVKQVVDNDVQQADEAAVRLQASMRGSMARKAFQARKSMTPTSQDQVVQCEDAAVKVQALYRGTYVRSNKHPKGKLEKMVDTLPNGSTMLRTPNGVSSATVQGSKTTLSDQPWFAIEESWRNTIGQRCSIISTLVKASFLNVSKEELDEAIQVVEDTVPWLHESRFYLEKISARASMADQCFAAIADSSVKLAD